MHPNAISKARLRLGKAKECIAGLRKARNHTEFSAFWVDVLIALNGVPNLLQEGAKTDAHSQQWYGCKKRIGRKDPLLSYMYQARNAEEHGLREVIATRERWFGIDLVIGDRLPTNVLGKFTVIVEYYNAKVCIIFEEGSKLQPIKVFFKEAILTEVHDDRFRLTFEVPNAHLGQPLKNPLPITAARLTYDYYCGLVDEAEKFVFSPKITDVIAM